MSIKYSILSNEWQACIDSPVESYQGALPVYSHIGLIQGT